MALGTGTFFVNRQPARFAGLKNVPVPFCAFPFTKDGFPDFSAFLYAGGDGSGATNIVYTGTRNADFNEASRLAGFVKANGTPYVPKGYVWHHSEELGKMELVRQDVHEAVRHTGGVAIYKAGMKKIFMDAGLPVPAIYAS